MEFRPVKFFVMSDTAALSLVRFDLSLKVKYSESHNINTSGFACEIQATLLFYLFCLCSLCLSISQVMKNH